MHWDRLQIANKKAEKAWRKYHPDTDPIKIPNQKVKNRYGRSIYYSCCLGSYRKTKVFCSSPFCCGNPRRIKGINKNSLTKQELIAQINEREQIFT